MTSPGTDREYDDLASRLVEERAELSPLELDAVKSLVLGRARKTNPKGVPMRTRLALMTMLMLGVLMSGTGATLALTGSSLSGSAAEVTYSRPGGPTVLGGGGGGDTLPEVDGQDGTPTLDGAPVQGTRQVADSGSDDSLPSTGFSAAVLMVGGVSLLIGGFVLRRRTHSPTI